MIRLLRSVVRVSLLCPALLSSQAARKDNAPRNPAQRAALEQQFRERAGKLAQQRLGLTDVQMSKLEQSNARFGPQLNQLVARERETRQQLRAEMTAAQPNQQKISDLIDASFQIQHQRLALVESEQKDLATFMTPSQRAGYIALQAQFRKRAQELGGRPGRPRR
jgi:Spy/CpxP family protein refolding chaperone